MNKTTKQCKDCKFLDTHKVLNEKEAELKKCLQGGYRSPEFPACGYFSSKESRPHNDDVNMFSNTDVKG